MYNIVGSRLGSRGGGAVVKTRVCGLGREECQMRSGPRTKRMKRTEDGREKRVFSRVECLVDLEVQCPKVAPDKVEAVDLSLLGVGIKFKNPQQPAIHPGDDVTVGMHGLKPVQGKVRWQDGERVGVQFCGRFHDIIESWVGEVLAAQGVKVRDLFSDN